MAVSLGIRHAAHVAGHSGLRDVLRAGAAAVVLFGACGFAPARLLLPAGLRRYELLWILPVGACAAAVELAALGYAAVPFTVSLALVLLGALALDAFVWVRGRPAARPGGGASAAGSRMSLNGLAWPLLLAGALVLIALLPVFRAGFATVIGTGSDGHIATGTAQYLEHGYPTGTDASQPLDQVPTTWRSKPPIYYVLAAVSKLSGLETYQAIATVAAILLALSAVGFFLLAREVLEVRYLLALGALAAVGLNRVGLFTAMNPYFNQIWAYMIFPFILVLSWWAVRERDRRGIGLLALMTAVCAFAYPLALVFPALMLLGSVWADRRRRRAAGERVPGLREAARGVYRGRRSLLWLIPVGLVLIVPLLGVLEKMRGALEVVGPNGSSLRLWAGDLPGFIPAQRFFGLHVGAGIATVAAIAGMLAAAAYALRGRDRRLAHGLGAVIAFGMLAGLYFRQRNFGSYFEFKTLAFAAPVVVVCAIAGLSRLRPRPLPELGALLVALLVISAQAGARPQLANTYDQLTGQLLELKQWAATTPPNSSIRLDLQPDGRQLWAAYMLADRRTCSQVPLIGTQYPHVRRSRKADFVLADRRLLAPFDSVGAPLRVNRDYALYRMNPAVPGPDNCSQREVETISSLDSPTVQGSNGPSPGQ